MLSTLPQTIRQTKTCPLMNSLVECCQRQLNLMVRKFHRQTVVHVAKFSTTNSIFRGTTELSTKLIPLKLFQMCSQRGIQKIQKNVAQSATNPFSMLPGTCNPAPETDRLKILTLCPPLLPLQLVALVGRASHKGELDRSELQDILTILRQNQAQRMMRM